AQPDLVILDVQLPDISGIEISRRLRKQPETRNIPILQISATFTLTSDKVQGLDAGADVYLATPVEPDELLAHIRTLLRLKSAQDALRESEVRYRSLVEATSHMVWSANERGELGGNNPSWCDFTGQSQGESHGFGWLSVLKPEERERVERAWKSAVMEGKNIELEFVLRRRDGEWRHI